MRREEKIEDAELIRNYKLGNEKAFEQLLYKYKGPLFNYIKKMVGNRTVAEDIFQDVWLKVIKALPRYKERGKFTAWLFKLAHAQTIDYLRRQKLDTFAPDELERLPAAGHSLEEDIEKKELISMLNMAVEKLPGKQKEVFLLRKHTDFSFKEIAYILGCPLNTALSRMHNAIINLRKIIKPYTE